MIRASIHFRKEDAPAEGWLTDLAELPRIGDEIRLLDGEGADLEYGTVAAIVHTLSGSEYRAGAQIIEVYVNA